MIIPPYQGLRELLEISQRNASLPKSAAATFTKRIVTHAEQSVQTDPTAMIASSPTSAAAAADSGLTVEITLPLPPVAPPRTPKSGKAAAARIGSSSGGVSPSSTAGGVGSSAANRIESSPEPGYTNLLR